MSEQVRLEVDEGVAVVTLNRPEQLNAFTRTMGSQLCDAYRSCDADDDVRAVVLTGEGRAFCVGADLSEGADVFTAPASSSEFRSDPFEYHAWDVRKPVIAAVNGAAIGLGMTLALHADIRIIARNAKCGIVQNRRGVLPDARSHWTLPRLIGFGRAAELLLTGRMFTGADAAEWGLASLAPPTQEVLGAAVELAHDMAVNVAPLSVGMSKRLLWRLTPPDGDEIDALERLAHLHLMERSDAKEGAQAFVDKRDPEWEQRTSTDWPDWLG